MLLKLLKLLLAKLFIQNILYDNGTNSPGTSGDEQSGDEQSGDEQSGDELSGDAQSSNPMAMFNSFVTAGPLWNVLPSSECVTIFYGSLTTSLTLLKAFFLL